MVKYEPGQIVRARYRDAPIPKRDRYSIGTIITILDDDTHKELAKYSVTWTDNTVIMGIIIDSKEKTNV